MKEALKCPICGAEPVPESFVMISIEYWRVKCPCCFCRTFWELTLDDAIHEWNRRTE